MNQKKVINKFDEEWIEIGIKSFARFFDLTIDEVYKIASVPNGVFVSMLEEINFSLSRYEDFMVKIKRMEERGEELTRLDILDL